MCPSAYGDLVDRAVTTDQRDDANDIFRAHAGAARSRYGLAADATASGHWRAVHRGKGCWVPTTGSM
jgi:hypothetical protein